MIALERTHEYRGLYHVAGRPLYRSTASSPGDLRIDELVASACERNGVAPRSCSRQTRPRPGEATASYIAERLRGKAAVTRLASGLPVGGDLE